MENDETTVSHLSSREEVKRFADRGNHAILSRCIDGYRAGNFSWEQAMQLAAIMQAESLMIISRAYNDLISKR